MTEFKSLSARQSAFLIRKGTLDPVELLEFHLAEIAAKNRSINALRYVAIDGARKEAEKCREEATRGQIRGRLHGVVFCAKDSINVKGMPRSDGTLHLATERAENDAALIRRLRAEGAICIGKGNMAEYGKSYVTDNAAFGRTSNPLDPTRTPGGSGGGDAAAVAAHFAKFGIGADAGGSIRIPAAFCGLFGLHTTRGLVSTAGLFSASHTTLQLFRSMGPIARSLEDIELLLSILSGYEPHDPYSCPHPQIERRSKKQFAYFTALNGVRCDGEIRAAVEAVAQRFTSLGYKAVEFAPPQLERCFEAFVILAGQAALVLEDLMSQEIGMPRDLTRESAAMKGTRQMIAAHLPPLTPESILRYWHQIDQLRHEVLPHFAQYDFILAPVAATLPPAHDTRVYQIDGQSLESPYVFQFASAANALGLPALSFPVRKSKANLPIGLQLIGARFSERDLISRLIEAGYEEALA